MMAALLAKPEGLAALGAGEWSAVIPMARRMGVLARLAYRAQDLSLSARLPETVWRHFEAAQRVAEKHRRDVLWEIRCLRAALDGVVKPLVLLKGAGYLAAELPPARGRTFSDIDILVPRAALADVERALREHGWATQEIEPYDDRYYRRWMHQLPPLTHVERGTTVDVHHTIVPTTARVPVAAAALLAEIRVLSSDPGLAVLQPIDMILHSAVHLFNEGQFDRALRDLDDIASLLAVFGQDGNFWSALAARAGALGLGRPLWYAVELCRRLMRTPVPRERWAGLEEMAPSPLMRGLMVRMFERALEPPLAAGRERDWALFMLYVRAHYLRMPLHRLVPHLLRKAVRREATPEDLALGHP